MAKLNAEDIHDTFVNCLFKEGEPTENHVVGEGVMIKIGFHPERLKQAEPKIAEWLAELPDEFKKSTGKGGWSFLNMCVDKEGNQWGEHQNVDELVALGTATKQLSFVLPDRKMWKQLYGGMPYLVVNDVQPVKEGT